MFKIAKLENVENENVTINYLTQQHCNHKLGKDESFKSLSFDISGDNYSFTFALNCKMEKLLEIPMEESIDFKDYIFYGETWLNVRNLYGIDIPEFDIKITRYLKNNFIVFLAFYTEYYGSEESNYSGMIEFTFNLDDYLDDKDK